MAKNWKRAYDNVARHVDGLSNALIGVQKELAAERDASTARGQEVARLQPIAEESDRRQAKLVNATARVAQLETDANSLRRKIIQLRKALLKQETETARLQGQLERVREVETAAALPTTETTQRVVSRGNTSGDSYSYSSDTNLFRSPEPHWLDD